MDNKEKFRGLCQEVLPLINGIAEAVKRNGGKFDVHIEGNRFSCYVILCIQRD